VLVLGGKLRALPFGRADAGVDVVEGEQMRQFADLQAVQARQAARILRVEAVVGAPGAVKEFAVAQQRNVRELAAHERRLAPTRMRDDQIGSKTLLAHHSQRPPDGLAACDLRLELAQVRRHR
jgi:hypothetical protein